MHQKQNQSYFVWMRGKVPDVVIEIVAEQWSSEDAHKMHQYARIAVPYYVIFDPENQLGGGELRAFALQRGRYIPTDSSWFPEVGLGLKQWPGVFEGWQNHWLRWCGQDGQVIPTGGERAETEHQRAETEHQRAERLLALLREHGIEPPPG